MLTDADLPRLHALRARGLDDTQAAALQMTEHLTHEQTLIVLTKLENLSDADVADFSAVWNAEGPREAAIKHLTTRIDLP